MCGGSLQINKVQRTQSTNHRLWPGTVKTDGQPLSYTLQRRPSALFVYICVLHVLVGQNKETTNGHVRQCCTRPSLAYPIWFLHLPVY